MRSEPQAGRHKWVGRRSVQKAEKDTERTKRLEKELGVTEV